MRTTLLAVLLMAAPMHGQTPFEVAVVGHEEVPGFQGCQGFTDFNVKLQWVNPDAVYDQDFHEPFAYLATPDHSRVFALDLREDLRIVQITPDGTETTVFQGEEFAGWSTNLAVSATGRMFALRTNFSHLSNPSRVAVISPTGILEAIHDMPPMRGTDLFAVKGECTLLFRKETAIGQFDACTGSALPDLLQFPPANVEEIDVLSDGRFILVSNGNLLLYDADGRLQRTIASHDLVATEVAVSADEQRVYVATGNDACRPGALLEYSIEGGPLLSRRPLIPNGGFIGMVAGTLPSSHGIGIAIPTTSPSVLIALALTLAFAGIFLLRR